MGKTSYHTSPQRRENGYGERVDETTLHQSTSLVNPLYLTLEYMVYYTKTLFYINNQNYTPY